MQLAHRSEAILPRELGVVGQQVRERRVALLTVVGILIATALAAVPLALGVRGNLVLAGILAVSPFLLVGLLVWLWQQPVRGVYVLLGAATVLPIYYRPDLPDIIGNSLPFFPDINTWTHTKGFSFSLADIFMVLMLLIWLLKGIAERDFKFNRGTLLLPFGLYAFMVFIGWAHGLVTGGDFKTSLWEVRGQAYMLVAYLLVCNLIKTRSHLWNLLWVLLLGAGVRGIEGTLRFFLGVRGSAAQELYPHEQSFFFGAAMTLTFILVLYGGPSRMKRTALLLFPVITMANLANERRAAMAALGVAVLIMLLVTAVAYPARRRLVALILLVLAVTFPPYYVAFQSSTSTLAVPARAVGTLFHPTARDALSDQYRYNEDADIMFTAKTSPFIGYGFGKPMLLPYPLPDISQIYVWWNIMPHNSILWIYMRLGSIGYFLLWLLIGLGVMQATDLARRLREPVMKGIALFIVLMLVQQVITSYLDLQWSNWRCLIATGILFGLISRLAPLARQEETRIPADSDTNGGLPEPSVYRAPLIPVTGSAVDDRRAVTRNAALSTDL